MAEHPPTETCYFYGLIWNTKAFHRLSSKSFPIFHLNWTPSTITFPTSSHFPGIFRSMENGTHTKHLDDDDTFTCKYSFSWMCVRHAQFVLVLLSHILCTYAHIHQTLYVSYILKIIWENFGSCVCVYVCCVYLA